MYESTNQKNKPVSEQDEVTPNLDAAIWGAELAVGAGPGRVYIVEPTGPVEEDPALTDQTPPGNPTMAHRSWVPLGVKGEVTAWSFYHGTRVDLKPGDYEDEEV